MPPFSYVSILAHLERWALRSREGHVLDIGKIRQFQSSPTSKGGRYDRVYTVKMVDESNMVSILAHLERWALRDWPTIKSADCMFQSSPTSKGSGATRRPGITSRLFQSSPTSKGGRYDEGAWPSPCSYRNVSILAHLERWALREFAGKSLTRYVVSILAHLERWAYHKAWRPQSGREFQSSPTSKGGRYACCTRRLPVTVYHVSILAHLERWALPRCITGAPRPTHVTTVSILAHLERWALRAGESDAMPICITMVFQSSPTSKGGRYARGELLGKA